ncbi:MAG TPA: MlaD family protein, partial [Solirubrobacteraceae bacterium]|nr:MlaD family protein [Solirubrobacteraceae bacterium]
MSQTSGSRRRGAAIAVGALCAVALLVAVLVATAAGGGGGGYSVRAIFDDAANIIPGEDVKVDGVKVGVVGAVTPTPSQKAAVVLHIENPGFQNFRTDASCTIEPEALIGEKFVNCLPTQPRPEGTPPPPSLRRIPSGSEGAGEYLLPVTNTSSPVDTDLLNDINRLPVRQRFTIIINELGAGLAGRGSDLNAVIRRANPALRELDKILAILARQNKLLTKLAVDSDTALQPVAKVKEQITNFIVQSDTVARASANQRGAIAQNLAALPGFLEQLGPAMERFEGLAEQTIPTFTALHSAAPGINQLFTSIAPFAQSSDAFFKSLGKSTKITGPALVALQPLLAQAKKTGAAAYPFSSSLSELFTSLRDTGGLERILDFIFLGTGTTNGYDALGHFLRAEAIGNACLTYALTPAPGCSAKFFNSNGLSSAEGSSAGASGAGGASGASASKADIARIAKSGPVSVTMARTLAVLDGATPAQAIAKF